MDGSPSQPSRAALGGAGCLALLGLVLGCAGESPSPTAASTAAAEAAATSAAPPLEREVWEIHRIGGQRVGYGQTSVRRVDHRGQPAMRIESTSRMQFKRAGQEVAMEVEFDSFETEDGKLLEFTAVVSSGGAPLQRTVGRVEGAQLRIELVTQGKTLSDTIPWSPEYGGFYAHELSLLRTPMKPGEERTIRSLVPGFNQLGTTEFAAADYAEVPLLSGSARLLRIEAKTTTADGQQLKATLWTTAAGDVLRRFEQAMEMESLRVTKAQALAQADRAGFDLVEGLSVPVERRLPEPLAARRIRYRLELSGANPAELLAKGHYQQVVPIDAQTAEVTVTAASRDAAPATAGPADPPKAEDTAPNGLIQSDDAEIRALAEAAAAGQTDPWAVAAALERESNRRITTSDYSQAFATAAEVVRSGAGDCTEHAVLLAALARARGIPARVAIGLVYTEETGGPAFGYHMWNECYLDGRWVPFDSTRPRGGAGAAYLKLVSSSLDGVTAMSSFLPVAQVAGRLKIAIEQVE